MNKKKLFPLIALLCIVAAIVMYLIGKESSQLSEVHDYFWIPLLLSAVFLFIATRVK